MSASASWGLSRTLASSTARARPSPRPPRGAKLARDAARARRATRERAQHRAPVTRPRRGSWAASPAHAASRPHRASALEPALADVARWRAGRASGVSALALAPIATAAAASMRASVVAWTAVARLRVAPGAWPAVGAARASFLDYKASVLRLLPSWAAVLAAVESFASARVLGDKDVEAALVALRKMGTGPTAWPPGW